MPVYETVCVLEPQLADSEIGGLLDKTKKLIAHEGGELLHEDKWGRRKLAYPIHHCREGFYVYLKYQAPPAIGGRLRQHFRVLEPVLRTLTVRHEERKPKAKKS